PVVLVRGQAYPDQLAIDDDTVYWVNDWKSDPPIANGEAPLSLRAVSKAGGAPVTPASGETFRLAVAIGQEGRPNDGIASDARGVYWASPTDGTILAFPKGSAVPVTLASGVQPIALTASGGYVYYTSYVPGGRAAFRVPNAGGPSEWLGDV